MEENTNNTTTAIDNPTPVTNTNDSKGQKQLAGAIIIAGVLIAGAILLKGNSTPPNTAAGPSKPISKMVGLNARDFQSCLSSGKYTTKIQASLDDGAQAGVNGTPASFILKDGVVVGNIKGAQQLNTITEQIKNISSGQATPLGITISPVGPEDHIIGDPNAQIVIVEYSDLECPFCKVFHQTMHKIVSSTEGPSVAWVYRHFPLTDLHPKAFHEAEAAECAWEQKGNEGFWKYIDKVFEVTPSNNKLDESLL